MQKVDWDEYERELQDSRDEDAHFALIGSVLFVLVLILFSTLVIAQLVEWVR